LPPFIVLLLLVRLDESGNRVEHAEVLERAHPDYAEPTLGVVPG
jgi:hypothetical protein